MIKIHPPILYNISFKSQWNFAHPKTAQLSWGVQNFVVIPPIFYKLKQFFLLNLDEISLVGWTLNNQYS